MVIYLLHIQPPYKHARHDLGIAHDLDARLRVHRDGHGARLTQVGVESGCTLELVRTWEGRRNDERRLKNQKNAPRLCPLCNPKVKGVAHSPSAHQQWHENSPAALVCLGNDTIFKGDADGTAHE